MEKTRTNVRQIFTNMTIIINPDFNSLKDFLYTLPTVFEETGETIYKARNEVKKINVNGLEINVKKYRKPIFINQIIYSLFRKSKAERAYKNGMEVIKKGFDTPTPIAYIEIKKYFLLKEAYFICLQCPYTRMFREFEKADITGKEHIIEALAVYTAKMQEKNIFHLDFSIGNILFEDSPNGVLFSIVDLNRMRFLNVDKHLGCRNFERLRGTEAFFKVLAKAYAKAKGLDETECTDLILTYHKKYLQKFNRHKKMKKFIRRK